MNLKALHRKIQILAWSALLSIGVAGSAHALGNTFFDPMDTYDTSRWQKSNGWTNGGVFNCGWRSDHIDFASDVMNLT